MRRKLCVFLLLTLGLSTYAQKVDVVKRDTIQKSKRMTRAEGSNAYEVSVPYYQYKSPEAAAFRRYGECAVSEYTGRVNITVPVYTLKYKDIEIPINLTYDASGIKVDQEASWVGLGWDLMVGGCINYVAAGAVDPRLLNTTASAWEQFVSQNSTGNIKTFTSNLVKADNDQFHRDDPLITDLNHGYGETDYFSVNFLGQSFLFMYDRPTEQYKIIGNGNDIYKIEDVNQKEYYEIDNAEWKITDGNGTQYFFMPGESTYGTGFQNLYTSTWYLYQIITQEGSVVNFSYTPTVIIPWRAMRYEQYDFVVNTTVVSVSKTTGGFPGYPGKSYVSQNTTSAYNINARYLSSITTPSEVISFTLGNRTDNTNAKRLEEITVKSKLSNQMLKKYRFNYSYFSASTVGGSMLTNQHGAFSYPDDMGMRLKLEHIDEYAGDTTLRTSFVYNENIKLPLKTSAAKDFWGYFNNQENYVNDHLTSLPTPRYLLSDKESESYITDEIRLYQGANRYCNSSSVQAAVLQKIIYPTKGYTKYVFEPHQFISPTKYPDKGAYPGSHQVRSLYVSGNSSLPNQVNHSQISLRERATGKITVTFNGKLSDLYANNANVQIIPMNPNIGTKQTYNLSGALSQDIGNSSYYTQTVPISLPANSYMMVVSCPKLGGNYSVSASIDLMETPPSDAVSTGGGLRIKRIENYDHDNALLDSTAYHYLDADGKCTGKLLQPMLLYEKKEILRIEREYPSSTGHEINRNGISKFDVFRLKQSSSAMTAFAQAMSGGTVGYSSVSKDTYNAQGHKLTSVISTFQNETPEFYFERFYYGVKNNGALLSQTVKDADNTIIRKVDNSYDQTTSTFGHILLMEDRVVYDETTLYLVSDFQRYRFWHFPFKYTWHKLTKTTTTTYDGSKTQMSTTSYDYNTTNHQVKKETSNSSEGITYVTEYKYPCDFSSTSPYNLMCNSTYFMQYPVIEQSLSAIEGGQTKLIRKRRETYTGYTNKYRDGTFNRRVFLPTATSYSLSGGSLESRLSYVYNDKCDRISITKDNTEKVTYLWAYNYMYPVAEIKGATYSDLTSWGLTSSINSLATKTTTTDVSSLLATIRSSLASRPVLMTSYTYDPSVGITGMTAPNGTKTTYVYDSFGRLSTVKNHDGTIIQSYSYNYKNN